MPEIRVQMNDAAVQRSLDELSGRIKNPSPLMKIIGEYMVRSTEDRFNRQGPAPEGSPWAPLAAATLRRKKHPKILTESGALRGDIHYQLPSTHSVAIGPSSRIPYGAIQQLGGKIHRGAGRISVRHRTDAKGRLLRTDLFGGKGLIFAKAGHKRALTRTFRSQAHDIEIPARPYLGVSAADSAGIVGLVNRYLAMR
jgi:phage gpG-like protein